MAGNVYGKSIMRTITGTFGRYIAIMAIIALGVGFFAGVKNTKSAMYLTCNSYLNEYNAFDFKVMSTMGFDEESEAEYEECNKISYAEAGISIDFYSKDTKGNSKVLRSHSLPNKINIPDLVEGRLPEKANECIVDDHFYSKKDIGKSIIVTGRNDKETRDKFNFREYKITGITKSPLYLMKTERGTTTLGDGQISAYVYIPEKGYNLDYYTEIYLVCKDRAFVFSEEYDNIIKAAEDEVKAISENISHRRYEETVTEAELEIEEEAKKLDEARIELSSEKNKTYSQLNQAKAELDDKQNQINASMQECTEQINALESQKDLALTEKKKLQEMLNSLEDTSSEYELQKEEIRHKIEYIDESIAQIDAAMLQIKSTKVQLEEGQKALNDGYEDYYSGRSTAVRSFNEAEKKLKDGEDKILEARNELSKLSDSQIYVQTRDDNTGISSFESNSDIVNSIAKVFPVFFFLIAALVCSTTMTRMVEEERTQIGALSALGYTSPAIMRKYMIYSASAALSGTVIGFLLGSKYFPLAIWIAYGMMFGFADLKFHFNYFLAAMSVIVALICSVGTTYFACKGQLKGMPAQILRPKAPKKGKRIFLERIGFLWSRMAFLHKVTARNIFRYKKRMFMMIVGICGCTALVLAALGLRDSVAGIAEHQFTEIEKYDMIAAFDSKISDEKRSEMEILIGDDLKETAILQQVSVELHSKNIDKVSNMIITDDEALSRAFVFEEDGNKIPYPRAGEAIINNKMAQLLNVEKGDTIEVDCGDVKDVSVKIAGIYKNYISNYIFINELTFEDEFDTKYEPSLMYVSIKDDDKVYKVTERINKADGIIGTSINKDLRNNVDDMMQSLNYIILLVLACAGALAFIVLFNLSNINITEREREIATIEVLGFYPKELGAYVFRENLILTIFGIVAGLPVGVWLHKFIMSRILVDEISFNNVIENKSYIMAVVIVLIFTVTVDLIMRRKLRKINMTEALKSIE